VINDLAPKERDLAMVFQSYALYPHMTVRENLSFGLPLRGIAQGRIDAQVRDVYEIRRLYQELRTTSVYVTHDQVEAMTMADRIVAMNDGIAQQIGPPQELYDDPANLFVAGFIGSPAMNLLAATLLESATTVAVMMGRNKLADVARPARMPQDGRVMVGIRPERIRIGAPSAGICAEVELIEATGIGVVVHVRAGDQSLKIYSTQRLKCTLAETIGIGINPSDLLLFDPDSGLRLRTMASGVYGT
jgi:multiple sugar transport system ATP-binding protein